MDASVWTLILLLQPVQKFPFVSVFPRKKFDFPVICGGHSSGKAREVNSSSGTAQGGCKNCSTSFQNFKQNRLWPLIPFWCKKIMEGGDDCQYARDYYKSMTNVLSPKSIEQYCSFLWADIIWIKDSNREIPKTWQQNIFCPQTNN